MKKLLLLAILVGTYSNIVASDGFNIGSAIPRKTGGPFESKSKLAPIGKRRGLQRKNKPSFNLSIFNEQQIIAKEKAAKEKDANIKSQLDEIEGLVYHLKSKNIAVNVNHPALTARDLVTNIPGDIIIRDGIQYNKLGYLRTLTSDLYQQAREKRQKVEWKPEDTLHTFFDSTQIDDLTPEELEQFYGPRKSKRFQIYDEDEEKLLEEMISEGMIKKSKNYKH